MGEKEKTLGQIAYEAGLAGSWDELPETIKTLWDLRAKAVAERCAQVANPMAFYETDEDGTAYAIGRADAEKAIRALTNGGGNE